MRRGHESGSRTVHGVARVVVKRWYGPTIHDWVCTNTWLVSNGGCSHELVRPCTSGRARSALQMPPPVNLSAAQVTVAHRLVSSGGGGVHAQWLQQHGLRALTERPFFLLLTWSTMLIVCKLKVKNILWIECLLINWYLNVYIYEVILNKIQ